MNDSRHTFAPAVHIEAMRFRSETDLSAYRKARTYQRRIKAALAGNPVNKSVLERLGRRLHTYRASGLPADLHWWLGEHGEILRSELRCAERHEGDGMTARQQARMLEASFAPHLSRQEAEEARELAWSLCKMLCSPTTATEAATNYQRTIALIDAWECS